MMIARSMWKGILRLNKMTVPVKLHAAIREERIAFHVLHGRDYIRLRQQMICAYEKIPVPSDEQVSGFEIEEGKYLIVEAGEMEKVSPEASRVIDIHEFVPAREVEPVYFERPYYLEADGQAKSYRILRAALADMNVLGICTWTMRKRSYFGALGAKDSALVLTALRYGDELIDVKELDLPDITLTEKESDIAYRLVQQLKADFDPEKNPEKFRDEHQVKLKLLIDKKARGEKIAILRPRRVKPTEPDKLMEALEASLKKVA